MGPPLFLIIGDETYIPFIDVSIRQESKRWVLEDDEPTTTTSNDLQKQRASHKAREQETVTDN